MLSGVKAGVNCFAKSRSVPEQLKEELYKKTAVHLTLCQEPRQFSKALIQFDRTPERNRPNPGMKTRIKSRVSHNQKKVYGSLVCRRYVLHMICRQTSSWRKERRCNHSPEC